MTARSCSGVLSYGTAALGSRFSRRGWLARLIRCCHSARLAQIARCSPPRTTRSNQAVRVHLVRLALRIRCPRNQRLDPRSSVRSGSSARWMTPVLSSVTARSGIMVPSTNTARSTRSALLWQDGSLADVGALKANGSLLLVGTPSIYGSLDPGRCPQLQRLARCHRCSRGMRLARFAGCLLLVRLRSWT